MTNESKLVNSAAAGTYEPSLEITFLPRCPACHAPHPLARKPKMPADTCQDCGATAAQTSPVQVEKVTICQA